MLYTGLIIGIVYFAILAITARQLLQSTLWLACTSSLLAGFLFQIGAHEIAVIELSVSAGLVTVLIVFTLNILGEKPLQASSRSYILFCVGITVVIFLLLGSLMFPMAFLKAPSDEPTFSTVIWEQRGLDTLLQLILFFCGALVVLNLITTKTTMQQNPNVESEYIPVISGIEQEEADDISIPV